MTVFHLTTSEQWNAALKFGEYRPPSLATEGFIHFSSATQLPGSANRFFASEANVMVLQVDKSKLKSPLREELADGMMFPHLYGPLNIDAVQSARMLPREWDGTFARPHWWPDKRPG